MIKGGYTKKILRVDLGTNAITTSILDDSILKDYLGGRGLGAYFFFTEVKPGIDPFAPESRICILAGPLQVTPTPYSPKYVIMNRSPLTGTFSRSVSGGGPLGPELKYAGYDALVVQGCSEKPVYIWINDDQVKIVDAQKHWGKTSGETEKAIRKEIGDDTVVVIPIGPAGENKVRFSGIISESRASGRGGAGAVMGSKRLKAIAVRGTGSVHVAHPEDYTALLRDTLHSIKTHPHYKKRVKYGTTGTFDTTYKIGALPIKNYSRGILKGIAGLMSETVKDKIFVHDESCFGCPLPCGKTGIINNGPFKGTVIQGPQFETIAMLGANCGNNDISNVTRANFLCNEYGLDTISTGNVIAFAIECYQRGLITKHDTDGMTLRFGDGEMILELIDKIAYRKGFGDLLAEGTMRAAHKIGQGSEKFAMHSKGQGFASFDPRGVVGMGLLYATAGSGANHSYGPTFSGEMLELKDLLTHKLKGKLCRQTQNRYCLLDSLVMCSFSRYGMDDGSHFKFMHTVTGVRYNVLEMELMGDRIYTLERLLNQREGFEAKDDRLPWRSTDEPMPDGQAKGNTVPLSQMLKDFYRERGWDENTGRPTEKILERTGLLDLATTFSKTT